MRSFLSSRMNKQSEAISWLDGKLRFLDQTRLPREEVHIETNDYREVAEAIKQLRVRGAPLIGIAAGYGLALAAQALDTEDIEWFRLQLAAAADDLRTTRPTAVNLAWALERLQSLAADATTVAIAKHDILADAKTIHEETEEANRRMGVLGAELLPTNSAVLTHCNAGWLACGGSYGTALGVVRYAWEVGKLTRVITRETRPLLQGARLTAWELARDGIPVTLITDSAAGSILRRGEVGSIVVGADRIAANGDVANKVGTYGLAVIAKETNVPFYVAAPISTIDLSLASGDEIPIEERAPEEVPHLEGMKFAPPGISVANPAFDITPHRYVTAIITEMGVARDPYVEVLTNLCDKEVVLRG